MTAAAERWLPVVGMEGRYEVSDQGRVRAVFRARPRLMTSSINRKTGYPKVCVCGPLGQKTPSVHVLVAEAFLGPRPLGHEINHKSGVKTDASVDNLEYVTPEENRRHAFATGLCKGRPRRPLSDRQIEAVWCLKSRGYSGQAIARALRVSPGLVNEEIASRDSEPFCAMGAEGKYRRNLSLAAAILDTAEATP